MLSFIAKEDDGMERHVFSGNFFHCLSFDESESVLNGFIAVEDGKVSRHCQKLIDTVI